MVPLPTGIVPAASFSVIKPAWWSIVAPLRPWLQSIFTLTPSSDISLATTDKLYPDGGASLVFERTGSVCHCFFLFNTQICSHFWRNDAEYICLRFLPGGVEALLNREWLEQPNAMIDVLDTQNTSLLSLLEQMAQLPLDVVVEHIQTWLLQQVGKTKVASSRLLKLVAHCSQQGVNPYEFALQQGVTRRTLERHCKQFIGLSPSQIAGFIRVRKARELLTFSEISLSEVALSVGYYDQSHFTNVFKTATFETPKDYRARKLSQISNSHR